MITSTNIINSRLTLKSFKTVKWMSEETICFTGVVVLDGKVIGEASNEGHGACTFIHYVNDAAKAAGEAFAKSIDPRDVKGWEFLADTGFTLDHLVDIVVEQKDKEAADKKFIAKIRRDAAKKVMYIKTSHAKGYYSSFKNVTDINRLACINNAKANSEFKMLVADMTDAEIFAHFAA